MKKNTAPRRSCEEQLDTLLDHVRAYKTRQDAIVLGLGAVRRHLKDGYPPAALDALDDLLASDLKQSKDRVDNLMLALRLAVDALEKSKGPLACVDFTDVLTQIELVAPEEFKAFQAPVAAEAS